MWFSKIARPHRKDKTKIVWSHEKNVNIPTLKL